MPMSFRGRKGLDRDRIHALAATTAGHCAGHRSGVGTYAKPLAGRRWLT